MTATHQHYRKYQLIGLCTLALLAFLAILNTTGFADAIRHSLLSHLTAEDNLPADKAFDAIYILGGGQESLKAKYKTLARLYAQDRCGKIMILSRPGTTEYSRELKRNLTNDEWSFITLEKMGVPRKEISPLVVESDFFGTFSEARCIRQKAAKENWNNILLITSPHHTKRVRDSFTYFLGDIIQEIWIVGSNQYAGFLELINEWGKLKVYQLFLLD